MWSQNWDGADNMPTVDDFKHLPVPSLMPSALTGQSPSVPKDSATVGIRGSKKTDSGNEENGNEEDLDNDNTSPKVQDSIQRGEVQPQSISSVTVTKKYNWTVAKLYQITKDEEGNEWFCTLGREQKTVYHSDIRNELARYAEESTPHGGPQYTSEVGDGPSDRTSYHALFDFCGEERADRPDCLFCFKQPGTKHDDLSTSYLVWNGMVVLDYRGEAIRALDLPLTISSKIGEEEPARLEAMLRLNANSGVKWNDILARMLRRGITKKMVKNIRNALIMRLVRFRQVARMIPWDERPGSTMLEIYHLYNMTTEMIAKNTSKGLTDVVWATGERILIEIFNFPGSNGESNRQKQENHNKAKRAKRNLEKVDAWVQAQNAWEAQNPPPAPSIYGELDCTTIESIVGFKLASLDQYRCDGVLIVSRTFTLDHAAPAYQFDNPRMEAFFGSPVHDHETILLPDADDPYGVLSSPNVSAAQRCIVDFLLEPARTQYRATTLVNNGSGEYSSIYPTNPKESYWQQLQALQSAFERCWMNVGWSGYPPLLCGLVRLDYNTMTWNVHDLPVLQRVLQSIHSSVTTLEIWKRRQPELLRAEIIQHLGDLEDDEEFS